MEDFWVWFGVGCIYLAASAAAGILMSWVTTRGLWSRLRAAELKAAKQEDSLRELEDNKNRHTLAMHAMNQAIARVAVIAANAANGKPHVHEMNPDDCPHHDGSDEEVIHFHGKTPPPGGKLTITLEREMEGVEEKFIVQKLEITSEGVKNVTPQAGPSQMDPLFN